ncbi:HesA/MoeB/ThiF family protein [Anaeromyxobacter paludicola]|uniref:THIF-type NAD/FAD binding fold domain-containing protein n=1 Tax=Anaeromyxobacter paludicola TaxID=2918171 RepID=A0ABN6N760_9BACT|nr:HesA/MoeB/ThiF family protein [Anaeromyxobacter paludicola]BDG07815.1 hypothetical protein AMPC_09280 [Anaeromyxobacter paludicola]
MSDLSRRSVLVVGAGGLGGPVALTLAAAGVGRLVLVDDDAVETSNLNRQPLFGERDLGERKVVAAARRLARVHPGVKVEAVDRRFDDASALELARAADLIVDGSDNFSTKFLASDVAVATGRLLVHGGVLRYTAQLFTIAPGVAGCLRCLFEAAPPPGSVPSCAEAGVLGPLAGIAGTLMAQEALRLLSGERGAYAGRLLVYDARSARARFVPVRKRMDCIGCEGGRRVGVAAEPAPSGGAA